MFYVQLMQRGASEENATCVRQMEDASKHGAERIKRGAEMNLNHDDYVQVSESSSRVISE